MLNIVYTVNNNFISQLGTSICSVCENNLSEDIYFYVISYGITFDNKEILVKFVQGYKKNISIIELDDLTSYFDFEIDTSAWNPIVLARLILPKLLPTNVERVLYLDGDTMVRGNLHSLWKTDLQDKVIGAVVEPTANREHKNAIGIRDFEPYFNAGVLLIDMLQWKKTEAGKRIVDFYREHNGKLFANDQDAINGTLKNEIYPLPIEYNFCNSYRFYPYDTLVKIMKPCRFIGIDDYEKAIENPIIVHFLGEERPWRVGNKNTYTPEYVRYWNKTPWKECGKEKGWENYFVVFNFFNIIMSKFPYCRYKIIDKLIPLFLKHRAKKK